jgi:pyrroloquinoline-quinone synthase
MEESKQGAPLDPGGFTNELRALGMSRYHHQHPFHRAMNEGRLTPEQLRGWIANRFHYQRHIPLKDAAILSNCPLREVRRVWIHRLSDHDGRGEGEGGLEAWLKLAEAAGMNREELLLERHVLPAVRFAVESYVTFARTEPWPIAVASSLTELFAPDLMRDRLLAFERFYPWIPGTGLEYFRSRVTQARKDSQEGLALVVEHCFTRELQERAVRALSFKCDVLWSLLDAVLLAYGMGPERSGSPQESGQRGLPGTHDRGGRPASPEGGCFRLSARVRFRKDPVTGKPTLLYPEGVMMLNPTGEAIVRLLDGERSVSDLIAALAIRYQVPPELLGKDVAEYLSGLCERHVVEPVA